MLYAQWRFRGVCPWEAYNRRPKPPEGVPWPSRLEAVLSAFAWYAAERERDVADAVASFGSGGVS